jgi:hypothetical protein
MSGMGHQKVTQVHVHTCQVCNESGAHMVQVHRPTIKPSGAVGETRIKTYVHDKCIGRLGAQQ